MTGTTAYNLLDEPWILALDSNGKLTTASIREALARPEGLRRIVGELPTQEVAILRLLLAILHRALLNQGDDEDARAAWARWWRDGSLPHDRVEEYLASYQDRFDLIHEKQPFFQVAGLRTETGKTSGLSKLIAEVPAGHQFFTTRTAVGVRRLDYAEAARWVVHAQAFDSSGIKSGAVGDSRVKGGKGYPIGIGWSGNLGLIVLQGETLLHTLLLNLVLDQGGDVEEDLPPWEQPPSTAAASGEDAPWGPAQAMTWQIRRLRLHHDGEGVHDAVISNGDPIRLRNQHEVETMTGFRRSKAQETKHSEALVYMPRAHQPGRAIWRGLESLIAAAPVRVGRERGEAALEARNVSWVAGLRQYEVLPADLPITVRTVGAVYGSNNSVIDTVISDQMRLRAEVLADRALQLAAVRAADTAVTAARILGRFAGNLAVAEGREAEQERDRSIEGGLQALDRPYREWLAGLSAQTREATEEKWRRTVRETVTRLALVTYRQASSQAVVGRVVEDRNGKATRIDAAQAHAWFTRQLSTEVPLERAEHQEDDDD